MGKHYSQVEKWDDWDANPPRAHTGQMQIHHTSDTVCWVVDGQIAYCMSLPEFRALAATIRQLAETGSEAAAGK